MAKAAEVGQQAIRKKDANELMTISRYATNYLI